MGKSALGAGSRRAFRPGRNAKNAPVIAAESLAPARHGDSADLRLLERAVNEAHRDADQRSPILRSILVAGTRMAETDIRWWLPSDGHISLTSKSPDREKASLTPCRVRRGDRIALD
jgi:hypothetical protein